MSNKAEQAAWDWATENKLDPYSMGRAYGEGYEQAEKDLALTWQDIQAIVKIVLTRPALDDYPPSEKFCKSVLEEFNKTRK